MTASTTLAMKAAFLALALATAAGSTNAQTAPAKDPTADATLLRAGFLTGHPDLRYRLHGLEETKQGKFEDAMRFFQRAGYYGDKPSQGMVAEMLWNGQGVERDRALAYVWMDLAAERGYRPFLILRERYWEAMNEAERDRAIAEGQAIYARYGDAASQPRLDAVLRREHRQATGSRTGFTGNLQIFVAGPDGSMEQIDGSKFYDPKYWDPVQYRALQDAIWMKPRVGTVHVGDTEKVTGAQPSASSRIPANAVETDAHEPVTPERNETDLGSGKPK